MPYVYAYLFMYAGLKCTADRLKPATQATVKKKKDPSLQTRPQLIGSLRVGGGKHAAIS